MITVKPFRAVRPVRDKAYLVATRSYVSYSARQHRDKLDHNPYTLLHVIDPVEGRKLPAGPEKYQLVRRHYENFCREHIFIKDPNECFYLYRQIKDGNEYLGIIAAVSTRDYQDNRIKKHEHTLENRERMFTDYLEQTGFNAEPVLLTYPDDFSLNKIMAEHMEERPEYEFTSTDKVLHQMWLVDQAEEMERISSVFEQQEALYIADGHHRSASSARLAQRLEHQEVQGTAHQYFMAFLIGQEQLKVYDYNRLIKGLEAEQLATFAERLHQDFWVENHPEAFKPEKLHEIGLYMPGQWYKLVPKVGRFDPSDAVAHLDAQILNDLILEPLLNIVDLKNDSRVSFMPGTEGVEGLQKAVDKGPHQMAFALYPVSIEQIKQVSDQQQIMPPKSTYVEPKLRSGLTIYELW